jgi:ankyrin repeat protein
MSSSLLRAMQNTPLHPELLLAACHGDHELPTSLLIGDAGRAVHLPSLQPAPQAVTVEIEHTATRSSASSLLQGVTPDGDSALHVVAAGGDGDSYLKSASVIYGKARHLLDARNKGRSTPLHRAARAGNVEMLSLLIRLAGEEGDEEEER